MLGNANKCLLPLSTALTTADCDRNNFEKIVAGGKGV
tara:strand:- start:231 stop:341 length:111 start_codon:yes stop_codon:yes gene_type:complete